MNSRVMGQTIFPLLLLLLHTVCCVPINIEHPDPIRVYIQNEITPENIRNDQLSVRLATHVPPSRPNEIPYFPPVDGLPPEVEQDAPDPEPSMEEDKYGLENLPPNIDLKPESIAEMILSSTIDKEEMVTNKPPEEEENDSTTEEDSTEYEDATTMRF